MAPNMLVETWERHMWCQTVFCYVYVRFCECIYLAGCAAMLTLPSIHIPYTAVWCVRRCWPCRASIFHILPYSVQFVDNLFRSFTGFACFIFVHVHTYCIFVPLFRTNLFYIYIRRAVVYQVPHVEQYACDLNNNKTASITHQVRGAVFHGGGSSTSFPVFVYYFLKNQAPN